MSAGCQSCQERLLDFLYGELTAAEQSEVRDHLATCESCQEELTELGATRSLMEQLPIEEPMRGMEAILQAAEREVRLRADEAPGLLARLGGWLRVHPVGVTAALAATVTLLVVSIDLEQEQTRLGAVPMKETAQPRDTATAWTDAPATAEAAADELAPPAAAAAAPPAPTADPTTEVPGLLNRGALAADLSDELRPAEKPEEERVAADGFLEDGREADRERAPVARRAMTRRGKGNLDPDALKDAEADPAPPRPAGKVDRGGGLDALLAAGRRADQPKNEARPRPMKVAPKAAAGPVDTLEGEAFDYRQGLPEGGGAGVRSSTGGATSLGQLSTGKSSSFGSGTATSRDLGAALDKSGAVRSGREELAKLEKKERLLGDEGLRATSARKRDRARSAGAKAQSTPSTGETIATKSPVVRRAPSADAKVAAEPAPAVVAPAPSAPPPPARKSRQGPSKAKKKRSAKPSAPVYQAESQPVSEPEYDFGSDDDLDLAESVEMSSRAGHSPVQRRQEQKSELLRDQLDRASALVNNSRCADALPLLDAILQQGDSPWRAEAYLYRGTCRSRLGQQADARSDFALAAALDEGRWSRRARKQLRRMESTEAMMDAAAGEAPAEAAQPASSPAMH